MAISDFAFGRSITYPKQRLLSTRRNRSKVGSLSIRISSKRCSVPTTATLAWVVVKFDEIEDVDEVEDADEVEVADEVEEVEEIAANSSGSGGSSGNCIHVTVVYVDDTSAGCSKLLCCG